MSAKCMQSCLRGMLVLVVSLGLAALPGGAVADSGATIRASVDSAGGQANGAASVPSISADGRYIAFRSAASNLVAGDTNGAEDVFVHDSVTGTTSRVSVSSAGEQGNGSCNDMGYRPSISADGRYVAFASTSSNLVADDANNMQDAFVHDCVTGKTTLVSVDSGGRQTEFGKSWGPAVSSDGRFVTFVSADDHLVLETIPRNDSDDVFVRDLVGGTTTCVSLGSFGSERDHECWLPSLSGDGRYVVFMSDGSDLVGGDTNGGRDVFRYDRTTSSVTRVSISSAGVQNADQSFDPSISADGRYVAFTSGGLDLVAGDSNGVPDTFVHDCLTGATSLVSVNSLGRQANGWSSGGTSLSGDGRYVAFESQASNLVSGDTLGGPNVYVRDRQTGTTTRASVDVSGGQATGGGDTPSLSADGRNLAFESDANNLVAGDTNGLVDVFRRTIRQVTPIVVKDGTPRVSGKASHWAKTTFKGTVTPAFVADVTISIQKLSHKKWKAYKTLVAKGGAAKGLWTLRVRLPKSTYRLRAATPASGLHLAAKSGWKTVKVR